MIKRVTFFVGILPSFKLLSTDVTQNIHDMTVVAIYIHSSLEFEHGLSLCT